MDQISQQFQDALGRAPSQAEMDFFSKAIGAGELSAYELGQVLQGHPEAQATRLKNYGSQYEQMLGASDQRIMNQGMKQALGDFAGAGRLGSSGLASAYANVGQNLAMQRQNALANFYGQGLGNLQSQYQNRGDSAMNRAYGLRDEARQWAREDQMYYRQKNDYQDMFRQQQNANLRGQLIGGGMGILAGAAGGAAGGMFGMGGMFGKMPVAPKG